MLTTTSGAPGRPACRACDQPACTGTATSRDAIVFLVHKARGDPQPLSLLNKSLTLLHEHYAPHVHAADILLWHEGDFSQSDLEALGHGSNSRMRLCLLDCCTGWGYPARLYGVEKERLRKDIRSTGFGVGYRLMCRFNAITMWGVLQRLGYTMIMRCDDNSYILSRVGYSIFERLRKEGRDYGWRMLYPFGAKGDCRDLDSIRALPALAPYKEALSSYCTRRSPLGVYNNWYVTNVTWWLTPPVQSLLQAIDDSLVAFTHRMGDHAIQSFVMHTLMPLERRLQFVDWTYEHVTIRNGHPNSMGGLAVGYNDLRGMQAALDWTWRGAEHAAAHRDHNPNNRTTYWHDPLSCAAPGVCACTTRETIDGPERTQYLISYNGAPACDALWSGSQLWSAAHNIIEREQTSMPPPLHGSVTGWLNLALLESSAL